MSADHETAARARWRQVQSLLDAALDLPASQRAAFLERSCGTDAALHDEVTQLLRACDDSADFLEQPVAHAAGALIAREIEAIGSVPPGTRIGPYRVIREIGRGGMGVVCLAERDDGEYQKRVALKVVLQRPGMEEWSVRRFREERQILASLEHPGIARMLDGGMWEGTPWFAMEYVDGLPIDEYCTTHQLTLDARVELFATVCDVVHYAHERAIIHRDLKPFNILVVDGSVKLLDFGIASLTSGDSPVPPASATTAAGPRSMTPGYASPEQARGEPATAASDVYSLGVLLYRMLTGRHPFHIEGVAGHANAEARVSVDALGSDSDIPPDLHNIIRTALHDEPGVRYPSSGAFAAAVRAYLGERAETAARNLREGGQSRFFTRTRAAYLAAAAVLALVVTGTLMTRRSAARSAYGSSAIAVLPFEPSLADSALLRLGRDLAITLSADLDGIGDIRTVDALTILSRRPAGSAHSTLGADMTTARAIGASRLLRGSITRVGGLVRLDATLYALDESVPLARTSTTVPAENVAAATDSLRAGILRELWRGRALPATTLAALATRSTAALREYLEGERLVVDYRMPEASSHFAKAIEADSSFWFAYWRFAWAREFSALRVDSSITDAYRAHRAQFPERDRLLIEARMAPRLPDRIELARKVAVRFPDYWPAWLDYAEVLVHQGPYAGHRLAEARAPLQRVVNLNPRLLAAWDHLMWIGLTDVDTATSGRVLATLERLRYDSAAIDRGGFQILVYYRYLDRLARSGGIPDPAQIDSVATLLSMGASTEASRFQGGMSRYGYHAARLALGQRIVQLPSLEKPRVAFQWGEMATTWASRGAWDSALVAADRARAMEPQPARVLFGYRLATIGVWLRMLDTSVAIARQIEGGRSLERLPASGQAELAWVDGLLAVARRDRAGIARARLALRAIRVPTAGLLDSSLMALELDLAGSRRQAIETLSALEVDQYRPTFGQHPYLSGINRLELSRWLREAGRREEAARLLVWHEAVIHPDGQTAHANAMLAGLAYFERARLEDVLGQPEVARAYDNQFLRRFDMPPPAQRHLVAEARAAIARP